eukprot:COSAG01_NODE_31844_length_590_cov_1.769857_1_plen_91_part_00
MTSPPMMMTGAAARALGAAPSPGGAEGGASPAGWRGRAARLGVGRVVAGELGWSEYALLPESELVAAPEPGSDDQEEAMGAWALYGCGVR